MRNLARERFLAARRRAATKEDELRGSQESYLRASGWEMTCDTPGSIWLWARPYCGRILMVQLETAVHMQDHIDSGVYPADGKPSDALERMGDDMASAVPY